MKLSKKLLMAALAGAIVVGGGVNTYAGNPSAANVKVDESEKLLRETLDKADEFIAKAKQTKEVLELKKEIISYREGLEVVRISPEEAQEIIDRINSKIEEIKKSQDEKSEEQIPGEVTKVEIREIEAPIKYQASDKLKLGEIGKKPLKKPVNGKVKVTITTKIIDGKEVKEEKEEVLVKEEAGIFEVGNKEVKEEITKFKTIEKKDDTLAKGVRKVKVKGKDGKVINTVTYDVDPVTGKLNNIKTNVEVKDKVVDEVILVGTNEKLAKQQDKKDKKDTKTPKKKAKVTLPKAGSEVEIITLSAAALSTAAGAFVSLKKRK